jgi:predicted nucleic acid-binding protein
VCLIKWDVVQGGMIYMKYPPDLIIPDNIVQQIQISHNFVESYITIEETNWNSISYYNEDKDIIYVIVLDKFDESQDYIGILDDFKKTLELNLTEEELKEHLKRTFLEKVLNVFRTRDEVISKLSNQVANLKTSEYDLTKRFEKIAKSDHLKVKSKIQFLLAINEEVKYDDLRKSINTSKRWLDSVLKTLAKNNIIAYNNKTDAYYLIT